MIKRFLIWTLKNRINEALRCGKRVAGYEELITASKVQIRNRFGHFVILQLLFWTLTFAFVTYEPFPNVSASSKHSRPFDPDSVLPNQNYETTELIAKLKIN